MKNCYDFNHNMARCKIIMDVKDTKYYKLDELLYRNKNFIRR